MSSSLFAPNLGWSKWGWPNEGYQASCAHHHYRYHLHLTLCRFIQPPIYFKKENSTTNMAPLQFVFPISWRRCVRTMPGLFCPQHMLSHLFSVQPWMQSDSVSLPDILYHFIASSVRVSGHYIQRTRYNWKMVKITTCSTMPLGHCAKTVKIATMATSAPLSWYQIEMKALKPRRPFIVKACQKGSLSSWPSSGVIRVVFITF